MRAIGAKFVVWIGVTIVLVAFGGLVLLLQRGTQQAANRDDGRRHDGVVQAERLNTAGPSRGLLSSSGEQTVAAMMQVPGVASRQFVGRFSEMMDKADPLADDWETEVASTKIYEQLHRLEEVIAAGNSKRIEVDTLFATGQLAPLRPVDLQSVPLGDTVEVRRSASSTDNASESFGKIGDRIAELRAPFDAGRPMQVHFKLFRVETVDRGFATSIYYRASGHSARGPLQQNATWICRWASDASSELPRLATVDVEDFEEVDARSSGSVAFADRTKWLAAGLPAFNQQLSHGMDHWRRHLERGYDLDFTGHHGIALGDINGDELEDIYLCQPGGLPNRVFVRQMDGTLSDVSRESGADFLDLTRGALLVDFDNDGDQDLALTQSRRILVLANDGKGHFSRRFFAQGEALYFSPAAADFDHDGDLDLYVCGYARSGVVGRSGSDYSVPTPYHDANNGAPNLLLRNDGNLVFNDVTRDVGLDENNNRFSFAASWEDFDNDADLDLYVANDFGRNNLYVWDANLRRFDDRAAEVGVEDLSAGMGVSWGDLNRDGWMDLYVSNMFSSAGGRIAYQRRFRSDAGGDTLLNTGATSLLDAPDDRRLFQRHARGNSLFENLGNGTMADVSEQAGVSMGRWAWGSAFADINNDGWQDIYVANGYITTDDKLDL